MVEVQVAGGALGHFGRLLVEEAVANRHPLCLFPMFLVGCAAPLVVVVEFAVVVAAVLTSPVLLPVDGALSSGV